MTTNQEVSRKVLIDVRGAVVVQGFQRQNSIEVLRRRLLIPLLFLNNGLQKGDIAVKTNKRHLSVLLEHALEDRETSSSIPFSIS